MFTLEDGKSPDHDFALNMDEFSQMVAAMRHCHEALGSNIKQVQENETKHLRRGRRSIYVVQDIKEGEVFQKSNLAVLRPGVGILPIHYQEVLGKRATQDIKAPALLKEGDWK